MREVKHSCYKVVSGYQKEKHEIKIIESRDMAIDTYISSHAGRKIQIGAGNNLLEGWSNTDFRDRIPEVVFLNATEIFPIKDQLFDYVFSEHIIEHITYEEGMSMLREVHRILKPGGIVRISTPDITVITGLSATTKDKLQREYIE